MEYVLKILAYGLIFALAAWAAQGFPAFWRNGNEDDDNE